MKKIDWVRKLTSRKLWTAVASFVSMMIVATGGAENTATQVTAEVDSFYTLTVPEEITLSGTDGTGIKTGTISVTLTGDIPLKGTVQVKTTATPLQAKGSVDVPMTIATPKVEWNRTEMLGDGTSSDYSVSAVLAPGDWTGTVTFECLVQ